MLEQVIVTHPMTDAIAGETTQAATAEPLRILVVDDSKLQRRIVALNLKRWGFKVMEAASGVEAMEVCRIHDVDMVLSDWMMPEMDGIEFCKAFRKLDRDRYGYFILLTSKSDGDDVALGLDVGADDFLSKPVNQDELQARIRAGTRVLDMEKRLIEQNAKTNQALSELREIHEEISKDLAEAEKLQQSLVPERRASFGDNDLSLLFQSSGHVGGDLVGFFSFEPTRLGMFSLDVSGHGISSALLTARLAGYFSPHAKNQNICFEQTKDGQFRRRSPGEVAEALNARMNDEMDTEHYFTIALADIDMTTGHVSLVQAGHPHPVVFNTQTGVSFVGDGGPPIGLIPGVPFETFELTLEVGDRLFLYSDGVTECQDADGTLLDDEGLESILLPRLDAKGSEVLSDLLWEMTTFTQGKPFDDDVSAILFEFNSKLN